MISLERFQPLTLTAVARWLEVHPFELVRILVVHDQFPRDLDFTADDVDRIREMGGLESWWGDASLDGVDPQPREIAIAIAGKLIERGVAEKPTRFDNVFRGMDAAQQAVARRVIQRLSQAGVLATRPTATGMHLTVAEGHAPLLQLIAAGEVPENLGL